MLNQLFVMRTPVSYISCQPGSPPDPHLVHRHILHMIYIFCAIFTP